MEKGGEEINKYEIPLTKTKDEALILQNKLA
jgi:hypothetical protein